MPTDHQSGEVRYGTPLADSGDINIGVPQRVLTV